MFVLIVLLSSVWMCTSSALVSSSMTIHDFDCGFLHGRSVYTMQTASSNAWQDLLLLSKSSKCWGEHGFTNHPFRNQDRNWRLRRAVVSGEKITLKGEAHWEAEWVILWMVNTTGVTARCVHEGNQTSVILEVRRHFCLLENFHTWFKLQMASGIVLYQWSACGAYTLEERVWVLLLQCFQVLNSSYKGRWLFN